MTQHILLSSSPESLRAALLPHASTATVEAEFGDVVIEGTIVTLAHHGPRAGNPCPCLCNPASAGNIDVFGLSHIDLDTIGGVLGLLGKRPGPMSFWELAAFIDVNGPHKVSEFGACPEDLARLYAWWAWSEAHRCLPPRDGSVTDVADYMMSAAEILAAIMSDDPGMLALGVEWCSKKEALNVSSFLERAGNVLVRVHVEFVNGLYIDPNGQAAKAVVAYNPAKGGVTISLADPVLGVSCVEIAQALWGPLAGGRAGIAGSPRGKRMCLDDLVKVRDALVTVL